MKPKITHKFFISKKLKQFVVLDQSLVWRYLCKYNDRYIAYLKNEVTNWFSLTAHYFFIIKSGYLLSKLSIFKMIRASMTISCGLVVKKLQNRGNWSFEKLRPPWPSRSDVFLLFFRSWCDLNGFRSQTNPWPHTLLTNFSSACERKVRETVRLARLSKPMLTVIGMCKAQYCQIFREFRSYV